jgi:hypothetical protein
VLEGQSDWRDEVAEGQMWKKVKKEKRELETRKIRKFRILEFRKLENKCKVAWFQVKETLKWLPQKLGKTIF